MAEKTINDKPKITDTILFNLTTPDGDGCFSDNPYKVDRIVIYFVERDFVGSNPGEYEKLTVDAASEQKVIEAEKLACADPSQENILNAQKLREELESKAQRNTIYFKERRAVHTLGNALNPAWISSEPEESDLVLVEEDENGDPQYGHFQLAWSPEGSCREGDYFICWTWTPLPDGESLSAHLPFTVYGDGKAVSSIPTHITAEGKYEVLLERYLPEMYKTFLSDSDLTPETTMKLNQAVADGFTFIEDFANQVIDLLDANVLHESLLVFLSNFFNLKLKSDDPTLWRRQIKRAVPLFKQKGTEGGLVEAFAQAGMTLEKITRYWQVVSKYTFQESFKVTDSARFMLHKCGVLDKNEENFGLWIRREGEEEYEPVSLDCITFETDEDRCETTMIWIGDELSANPVELYEGDIIKVLYQFKEVPDDYEQQIEEYIRALDLADTRDEADQDYPPKNWNVHIIEEDDVLFSVIVPVRHPYHELLVFGQIRTEFPYSENIYNMEEYNGSTRDSFDACMIDKKFLDPCGSCASSKFSVDVAIEELANHRLMEVNDILNEYKPFHAVVHNINFSGEVEEIIPPPEESIERLITISKHENVIAGGVNPFFYHGKPELSEGIVLRSDLADEEELYTGESGTAYNTEVRFVSPDYDLKSLGIWPHNNLLEVMSPSANAGTYTLGEILGRSAKVTSDTIEPIDSSMFTFRLMNVVYSSSVASVEQANIYKFSDANVDFAALGVKTAWDAGSPWKVSIPAYSATPYEIADILPDGTVVLTDDNTLPTSDTDDITYTLLTEDDEEVAASDTGSLIVGARGLLDLNDPEIANVQQIINTECLVFYDGNEYEVSSFDGNDIYIKDYDDGDASGIQIEIRRVLVSAGAGLFGYKGLELDAEFDLEGTVGILNGQNAPPDEDDITDNSYFKENFLVRIDSQLFKIVDINGAKMILDGLDQEWMTRVAGGTSVTYDLLHYNTNVNMDIDWLVFDQIDRDGHDVIVREIEDVAEGTIAIVALSTRDQGSGIEENIDQKESISFTIEWANGQVEEGEL